MKVQRYPIRPLQCWQKGMELRRMHRHHIWEAQKKGELLVHGMAYFHSVLYGMGDYANTEFTPYFRALMENHQEAIKCHEAAEVRGYGQDICSSMRCHLGAAFLGFGLTNRQGETVKPDFIFQGLPCNSLAKAGQIYSDYWGLPYFTLDIPFKDSPATLSYLVAQLHEFIEWMEKLTGRRFNDENLLRGARNEWRSLALFARVLDLNRAVPVTLDLRHLFALQIPAVLTRHKDEVVQFYEELADEVAERVKDGISARGYETMRLMHGGFPPLYYMGILRYPAQFGAVYVGSDLLWQYALWSTLKLEEGGWQPAPLTPEEAGFPLCNREDALRLLAELYLRHRPHTCPAETFPAQYTSMVDGWKIGAAVIHIDRGCKGLQAGILEGKLALDEKGVPTLAYEASGYDPRDFSEVQVMDRMETFMDNLGLKRIQPQEKGSGYGVL